MSKMGLYDPFGHIKHKLWPKESNWQFDSRPLKVGNWPDFLTFKWSVTYCWKALDKGYNFSINLITIESMHTKLWGPKSRESQFWEFQNSHLGVPGHNSIWMWASWRGTKYTIRGKVVPSPKSGLWWVLWVWVCPWFILTPKVLQPTYCLVLCMFVWMIKCLSFFLVPSRSSSMPLYPQNVVN